MLQNDHSQQPQSLLELNNDNEKGDKIVEMADSLGITDAKVRSMEKKKEEEINLL